MNTSNPLIYGAIIFLMVLLLKDNTPFDIGRLPGDFYFNWGNSQFYFPLTSMIIVSVILSFLSRVLR